MLKKNTKAIHNKIRRNASFKITGNSKTTIKAKLFLLSFLTITTLLFGQTAEKISVVRKKVEAINTEKSYQIKKLDNDYFVNVKNEATDCRQELSGIIKIEK